MKSSVKNHEVHLSAALRVLFTLFFRTDLFLPVRLFKENRTEHPRENRVFQKIRQIVRNTRFSRSTESVLNFRSSSSFTTSITIYKCTRTLYYIGHSKIKHSRPIL